MRIRPPAGLRGPLVLVVAANVVAAAVLAAVLLDEGSRVSASGEVTPSPEPGSVSARSDPYTAAVTVSQEAFPSSPVRVAFVVTAVGTRDALTAGPPAAVLGGPVLPVAGAGIPPVVREELARLAPRRIIVLGGPAAVSDDTATALEEFTEGSVTRLAGTDRYATAAQAATTIFTGPVPQVLVVIDSEDLALDPRDGATTKATRPVLLTTSRALSPQTAGALRSLRPRSIAVLGEPSQALLRRLSTYTQGAVVRLPISG